MRYERQAFRWWVHDVIVHPISGTIGLLGNLLRSFRLMALAHHLHNGSAPSNDAVADYITAAARACENETAGNPSGTRTPDEQAWLVEQARVASGRTDYIPFDEAEWILRGKGIKVWEGQASGVPAPPLLTQSQVETGLKERRRAYVLERAEADLAALLDRRFTHYQIRDMGEEGKEALRVRVVELTAAVNRARRALEKECSGHSVRELLAETTEPSV